MVNIFGVGLEAIAFAQNPALLWSPKINPSQGTKNTYGDPAHRFMRDPLENQQGTR